MRWHTCSVTDYTTLFVSSASTPAMDHHTLATLDITLTRAGGYIDPTRSSLLLRGPAAEMRVAGPALVASALSTRHGATRRVLSLCDLDI